ncbi:metallophosphoesterase [Microscilla marina]|uniref:Metallophosphoesterase n=1 Tax=Microscilla marina ATCC 23134 TaxID=313606 RepID=A1ZPA0_MICM2|nr:metallophosphoesterase [Microscilla marina]EAY27892.1 metallophosphoesterase [Microscilla marina ATCC 23134]
MSKTYVIGDIHGCYDELMVLLDQMQVTDQDLVVSLGDIVDRGLQSLEVYHYFKNRPNVLVLMGNHERKHLNGILSYSQEIVKVQFGEEYAQFREWLGSLGYYYKTKDAIIVHAFFEHDKNLETQKEDVLAGTTSGSRHLEKKYPEGTYWADYYQGHKPIIYGHQVVGDTPKVYNHTYGIDTGACHGGKLTAIELPGFKIHQVKAAKDYWKIAQSEWQIPVLQAKKWESMTFAQIQKQLDKLAYKQEAEVVTFIKHIQTWLEQVIQLLPWLKSQLEQVSSDMQQEYGVNFNQEASKLPYRTFIFKARAGNLSLNDVSKALDTPHKVTRLAQQLGLDHLPQRQ